MTIPKSRRDRLAESILSAFESRQLPKEAFDLASYEGQELAALLEGVERCEIGSEFVDGIRLHPANWFPFMTTQGLIYFFPALMSLCVRDWESYDGIPSAIVDCLSPWPFASAPHKWRSVIVRAHPHDIKEAYVQLAVRALMDPEEFVKRSRSLVLSMNARERRATRLFVNLSPAFEPMDPLYVYAIEETLDGRVEPGDGYSWLPKHEMNAVIDFIDFLVDECGSMLSEPEAGGLLVRRSSFDSG